MNRDLLRVWYVSKDNKQHTLGHQLKGNVLLLIWIIKKFIDTA